MFRSLYKNARKPVPQGIAGSLFLAFIFGHCSPIKSNYNKHHVYQKTPNTALPSGGNSDESVSKNQVAPITISPVSTHIPLKLLDSDTYQIEIKKLSPKQKKIVLSMDDPVTLSLLSDFKNSGRVELAIEGGLPPESSIVLELNKSEDEIEKQDLKEFELSWKVTSDPKGLLSTSAQNNTLDNHFVLFALTEATVILGRQIPMELPATEPTTRASLAPTMSEESANKASPADLEITQDHAPVPAPKPSANPNPLP